MYVAVETRISLARTGNAINSSESTAVNNLGLRTFDNSLQFPWLKKDSSKGNKFMCAVFIVSLSIINS